MPLSKIIKGSELVFREINLINHKDITYKNKKYVVCYVLFNNDDKLFIIDESKKKDIINKKWIFKKESGYISKSVTNEGKRSELYLHNFVMNNIDQTLLIDHINDHGCDNRLENLQVLSKIEYNNNIKRKFNLPPDCHIEIDNIPKFITYRKSNSSHGDMFVIDIKLPSSNIYWHSTSAKSIDTNIKLKQAIDQLKEFNKSNLELRELNTKINNIDKRIELIKSYNEILLLSEYPIEIINKNLINLKKELKIEEELKLEDIKLEPTKEYLNEIKQAIKIEPIKKNKITIKEIDYNNKKYIVGYCAGLNIEDALFVSDYDKKDFIIKNKWFFGKKNKYIYATFVNDGINKYLYQHLYVIDGLVFDQDPAFSIDHINQIGRDNRLENLRKLSHSHQNINRGKLIRKVELPEGCDIDPQDIPTNIYYKKPQGLHGDRFCIEIKNVNPPYKWDSTSSKSINLKTKLQQTILKLEEYKKEHPEYASLIDNLKNVDIRNNLRKSFNDILQLSGFPQEIINKNLAELEEEPKDKIDEDSKDLAKQLMEEGYKNISSNLPKDCGVTPTMIPKYCYYKPASERRGDKFIIERHPKLVEKGIRQWATTEAKGKTTKDKFDLMILKLIELEN